MWKWFPATSEPSWMSDFQTHFTYWDCEPITQGDWCSLHYLASITFDTCVCNRLLPTGFNWIPDRLICPSQQMHLQILILCQTASALASTHDNDPKENKCCLKWKIASHLHENDLHLRQLMSSILIPLPLQSKPIPSCEITFFFGASEAWPFHIIILRSITKWKKSHLTSHQPPGWKLLALSEQ